MQRCLLGYGEKKHFLQCFSLLQDKCSRYMQLLTRLFLKACQSQSQSVLESWDPVLGRITLTAQLTHLCLWEWKNEFMCYLQRERRPELTHSYLDPPHKDDADSINWVEWTSLSKLLLLPNLGLCGILNHF